MSISGEPAFQLLSEHTLAGVISDRQTLAPVSSFGGGRLVSPIASDFVRRHRRGSTGVPQWLGV